MRSTLAAETQAMDMGVDIAVYYALFIQETIPGCPRATARELMIEVHAVTDCKSLYDTLTRETGNLEEKRTLIDIASIRETMAPSQIHWVPTGEQKADGLTKDQVALRLSLTQFMRDPIISLRDPEDPELSKGFERKQPFSRL